MRPKIGRSPATRSASISLSAEVLFLLGNTPSCFRACSSSMLQCSETLLQRNMRTYDRFQQRPCAKIQAFRQRFESLLTSARGRVPGAFKSVETTSKHAAVPSDFGANPGNLRMLAYVPENLPAKAPVVVALHGCSQTASEYDHGAGWSALADRLGFLVVYPEQLATNNPKNCFSWFLPGDTARGDGEALSIYQMVEHAIEKFGADRQKVFVTGLSAGGAMAVVMLATYPETFAGGAIIAGLPYKSAKNVNQAFEAMFTDRHYSPRGLGDRVRRASKHHGPWPKISIWHGSADPIVKPSNAEQIVQQWTDVHSLSPNPSYERSIGRHTHRVWNDPDGDRLIEAFTIQRHGAWRSARFKSGRRKLWGGRPFLFGRRNLVNAPHRELLGPR